MSSMSKQVKGNSINTVNPVQKEPTVVQSEGAKEVTPKKKQEQKKLRKPPVSRQSQRFKHLENRVLEITGDDYWSWLEEKYQELIVNDTIGFGN